MGIAENLKLMKQYYGPDWAMRLYYDIPDDSVYFQDLCKLACDNKELDLCDSNSNPKFGEQKIISKCIFEM